METYGRQPISNKRWRSPKKTELVFDCADNTTCVIEAQYMDEYGISVDGVAPAVTEEVMPVEETVTISTPAPEVISTETILPTPEPIVEPVVEPIVEPVIEPVVETVETPVEDTPIIEEPTKEEAPVVEEAKETVTDAPVEEASI